MNWSESSIILAIIGMVGLFATAITWQRANRITGTYYSRYDALRNPSDTKDSRNPTRIPGEH